MTIERQQAQGELVKVATAQNQSEAELLEALLLDAGVRTLVRRSAGFDVPDFLAAGPRDLLVDASDVRVANLVLLGVDDDGGDAPEPVAAAPAVARLVGLGLVIGLAVLAALLWLLV